MSLVYRNQKCVYSKNNIFLFLSYSFVYEITIIIYDIIHSRHFTLRNSSKKKSLIVNSHWKQKKKNKNPKVKTKQIEKKSHPTQREAIAPETLPRKKFHFASSTSTRSPFSSCTPPATTTTNKKKIEKQSFFFTGYAVSKLNKKGNSQLLKK